MKHSIDETNFEMRWKVVLLHSLCVDAHINDVDDGEESCH